jgi:hypothetical protein
VSSILSVPPAGDGTRWSFPSGQRAFDLRIEMDGRGTVDVVVVLRDGAGHELDRRERRFEVVGPGVATIDGIELPADGGYRLSVDVTGPGVRQSQTITIGRG